MMYDQVPKQLVLFEDASTEQRIECVKNTTKHWLEVLGRNRDEALAKSKGYHRVFIEDEYARHVVNAMTTCAHRISKIQGGH